MDTDSVIKYTQLVLLAIFLYSTVSLHLSLTSILSGTTFLGVFLIKVFDRNKNHQPVKEQLVNPYKGKPQTKTLPTEIDALIDGEISQFVTYDAARTIALSNFSVLQEKSPCIFANGAKVWSSTDWDKELSLEENVFRSLPTFFKFILSFELLGLDGFVFELPMENYCDTIEVFAKGLRRVLKVLCDNDPGKSNSLTKSYIDKRGWVFEFNKVTMFITTFAPFYPITNSRCSFGCKNTYILFQPEVSFAKHDLPPDTPHTNWEQPETVRDRIRVAFRDAGQGYHVPATVHYPMSHDIVKPINEGDPVIEWWTM